ncbi:MAG: DUF4403 family protein [Bacteroidota bacterium]|nr:DUF4403 family protein [Bacteroidota bacterium]
MLSTTISNNLRITILVFFLITLHACKTLKPLKPEEAYPSLPNQKNLSTINIPIDFPLSELEKQINKQVAGLIYEDDGGNQSKRENFHFKVWKRDNISVQGKDDKINIKVPLKIWVKADMSLKQLGLNVSESKDTEFEIDLHFLSKLSVDSNYQVVTDLAGNGFEWIKKPKIKMGFLEISLSSLVEPYIEDAQNKISTHIVKQIQDRLDIKKHVAQAWKGLQKPIRISEEYQAWLYLNPVELHMSPLHINENKVNATIGFMAVTETIFGEKPENPDLTSLPFLKILENVEDDFTITFSGEISQEKARQIISDKFVGRNFTFQNGKRNVTITAVDLYGSGGDMIIEADLTGSIEGKVFLSGKPQYDTATQSLIVQDLDYTLDTKNKLTKTANWLVKGRMVKNLEESLTIPLETQMAKARTAIEKELKHKALTKGIFLNGTLEDIVPSEVYMTEDSIVALVKATGKAEITVNGL